MRELNETWQKVLAKVRVQKQASKYIGLQVETDKVKNIVGYLDEKKIRIVSVLGNNPVDDSIVAQIIGDRSYLLSCLLGSSGWTQQRNKIILENGWVTDLGYRAISSIDVSLKKVYVEKV